MGTGHWCEPLVFLSYHRFYWEMDILTLLNINEIIFYKKIKNLR